MNKSINILKKLFTFPAFDRTISHFTQKKKTDNFFVRLLPSNLQYKTNAVRTKTINGINYQLHLNQWMEYVLYFGIAVEDKAALYNLVKPGMNIIDVGVNFGETLLNFSKLTGTNGKVFGFEPMPYIFEKCKYNISLNQFKNVTLENLALSDKNEELIVNDPLNGNSGGTYVSKITNDNTGKIIINATTLDDYVQQNEIEKIDLVKIDVEGFESNVLSGAVHTLQKFNPLLYIELNDDNLKKANSSARALITSLIQLNYRVTQAQNAESINLENFSHYPHTDIIAINHIH